VEVSRYSVLLVRFQWIEKDMYGNTREREDSSTNQGKNKRREMGKKIGGHLKTQIIIETYTV